MSSIEAPSTPQTDTTGRYEQDSLLLETFVSTRSDEAFNALFQRYYTFVHGVCCREARDPEAGADAAQAVFIALYQKAHTLRRKTALCSWLFQAALFASRDVARRERCRMNREQRAVEEQLRRQSDQGAQWEQEVWQRLDPVLNGALAHLNTADRTAILLRYFDGLSLSECGMALNTSSDGVRMRIGRALGKMRRHIECAGIALTAAALASVLDRHARAGSLVPPAFIPSAISHAVPITTARGPLFNVNALLVKPVLVGLLALGAAIAVPALISHNTASRGALASFQPVERTMVTGKVVTPDGRPVRGAAVDWIERSPDGDTIRRMVAKTDATGAFQFPEVDSPPGERPVVTLLVRSDSWGMMFHALRQRLDSAGDLTIKMRPAARLRVPFVDSSGNPLAHIDVRIRAFYDRSLGFLTIPDSMHGRWEQRTDAHGIADFPSLPQGVQVRFGVDDRFAVPGYGDAVSLAERALQTGPRIQLIPGGVVQGKVIRAKDGKPAVGVRVGAQAAGLADGSGHAVTDTEGRYRIAGLRPAAYNVALLLRDDEQKSGAARALEMIAVKSGETLENQDLRIISGAQISGRVTDKGTGKPVEGVSIGIYGPAHPCSGASVQSTKSGPDGAYHTRVPGGAQHVYVCGLPSHGYELPKEGADIVVADDVSVTQDFALTPSPLRNLRPVRGRALGPDGRPTPGVTVTYRPVGTEAGMLGDRSVETDASGAFAIEMLTASVRVRGRSGALATETTVLAQSGDEVTMRLKPNVLVTLRGRVLDDRGGPIQNARVRLVEWWLDTGLSNVTARTDDAGRFAFVDLYPDARYSITAEADGFGQNGTRPAQVRPGEQLNVADVQLQRAHSSVSGRVVDEHGDPIARQIVRAQGRLTPVREAVTDAHGVFRFEAVVKERLTLYLADPQGTLIHTEAMAGDSDVIIVRQTSRPRVNGEEDNQQTADRRKTGLLAQPGPALRASAWLNTDAPMSGALNGKIVVIDFWAIGCPPCVASLPAVQRVSDQFSGRGVVVVGLHSSGIGKEALARFIKSHKLTYPMAIDADDPHPNTFGQTTASYGVLGIPTVAVLDRHGVVRYLDNGLEGAVRVVDELLVTEK